MDEGCQREPDVVKPFIAMEIEGTRGIPSSVLHSVKGTMAAELNDEYIERLIQHLRTQFPSLEGMQHTGPGQYVPTRTMQRFQALSKRRPVQILNVGDHWICATNRFYHVVDGCVFV